MRPACPIRARCRRDRGAVALLACALRRAASRMAHRGRRRAVAAQPRAARAGRSSVSAAARGAQAAGARLGRRIDAPRKQKWLEIADALPEPCRRPSSSACRPAWPSGSKLSPARTRPGAAELPGSPPAHAAGAPGALGGLPGAAAGAAQQAGRARRTGDAAPRAQRRAPQAAQRPRDACRPSPTSCPTRRTPRRPGRSAPTVVQAQPGATTTLISKRPRRPSHQQPGLPKIAATPGFVDKSTLLPQRGPQGAATRGRDARTAGAPRKR